jgi:hypothetical protein
VENSPGLAAVSMSKKRYLGSLKPIAVHVHTADYTFTSARNSQEL